MIQNSFCRNCGYTWSRHPAGAVDNETYIVVRVMLEPMKPTDCVCMRFKPMDNLEYLEWLNDYGI